MIPLRQLCIWLLLSSVLAVLPTEITHAQSANKRLIEVYRFEGRMANPTDFYLLEDDQAVLIDRDRPDCALALVQMPSGEHRQCYRIGQGPGEIQSRGTKVMYRFSDGRLWLTDGGRPKIYASDLEFIGNVRGGRGSFSRMLPINDSTVVATPFIGAEAFLHFYRMDPSGTLSEEPIHSVQLDSSSPLFPVTQNFMLNQGPYAGREDALFMGFNYSSHLVKVTARGIHSVNDDPADIPFPEYNLGDNGGYEAPNSADFPECTMGIATDEQYVYVLHHGETFDIGPVRQLIAMARGRIAAKIEAWELTDRVFIYDGTTGDFVREIQLPVRARKVRVTDRYLYVLTISDGPATIIKYEKPATWAL